VPQKFAFEINAPAENGGSDLSVGADTRQAHAPRRQWKSAVRAVGRSRQPGWHRAGLTLGARVAQNAQSPAPFLFPVFPAMTPQPHPPGDRAALAERIKVLEARERHLCGLIDSARDAVLEMDAKGMLTSWHASAERMLGWTADEALGRRIGDVIVPPQHRSAHDAAFAMHLEAGQDRAINRLLEIEALHKDGSLMAIELSVFTVLVDGRPGFGASIRDISRRRAAEQALRLSEERYRAVIEHVSDGMVVMQGGQVVFSNPAAATLLGRPAADILRHGFLHWIHPDDQQLALAQQQGARAGDGAGPRVGMHATGADGSLRRLSVGMIDIPWAGQRATLCFFSDVTASHALEEVVKRTNERYKAVVEHVDEGMIVIKDERIAYSNARAAEIVGMSLEDMQQVGFLHRVHPDDHELVLGRQRRRLAGEEVPSRYEVRLLLPGGVVRWIGIGVSAVPWDGGRALLIFFSDISERKALEARLRETLEQHEVILDNSLVGIAFLTHDGAFRWSNRAMARIFGMAPDAPPSADLGSLFASLPDYEQVQRDFAGAVLEGRVFQRDLEMRRVDGSTFWITASGKAVSVLDKTQGSVWAAMDITHRKQLEAALERTSSEREAIFNSALVGISFNINRRAQWVNDKFEEMTGYSRAELVGNSSRILYRDDATFEADGRLTRAALVKDGVYVDERRFYRRNGEGFWVQLAGRCVHDRNPDAGVIWTLLDITGRRQAEDNIRAALEREKELNDLRSRFVSMTSHEFRTPLAAILSAAELLRDFSERMPAADRAEVLESIGAAVKRMAGMLDRVLLIGQVEAEMLEFKPAPTDVAALCSAIAEDARALQGASGCELLTRFGGQPPGALFDAKLLRHILGNLLSNAIKYATPASAVTFSSSVQAGRMVFEVENQGIGIPAAEIPHLFQSFQRASNVGDIPGSGLGLAIVRKCIELHGGEVEVRSDPGRSTRFTVTL
jgi:PAS domain S-box-containing protein